ncbi:hypothetical protein QWJ34_17445 [Saccharibacillus sp. CPCC 101409]|uniref:hypothetical protein n=1 Tax=Saccharibacillus sp. CPCC 101409 TaxID=3058041 RepID=UPI002671DA96|nr:hypothetical protein [Saccharibacillus sp. CPCC 101409]MDO3411553.1 hypothetical protein [Saccharibacillus sp. CPCC 101409]
MMSMSSPASRNPFPPPAEIRFDSDRPQDTPDISADRAAWSEALFPFVLSPAQAEEAFRSWRKKQRLAPGSFKRAGLRSTPAAVYMPYWSFSAGTRSSYRAQKGINVSTDTHYTETDSNGNTHTRTETSWRTDYMPVSGEHEEMFGDVRVPASAYFDRGLLDQIDGCASSDPVAFSPAYAAGCIFAAPSFTFAQGWKVGKSVIEQRLRRSVTRRIGGDSVDNLKIDTEYRGPRFRRVLVPIYEIELDYRGKPFSYVMNGSTGSIAGRTPRSFAKTAALYVSIAAIILLVVGAIVRISNL